MARPRKNCGHSRLATGRCKECLALNYQRWKAKSPTRYSECRKRAAAKPRSDVAEHAQYTKRWKRANPQRTVAHARRNYVAFPDKAKANVLRWKRENPERHRELQVQAATVRRGHKLAAGGSHTLGEWHAIVERQGGKCAICGEVKRMTRDHIHPISRGGSNDASNIQGLCKPCNSRKGARTAA